MIDWSFNKWPRVEPQWHDGAALGEYDRLDFHVDLGCGRLKKGRIGIDRYPTDGVNVVMDLDRGLVLATSPSIGRNAVETFSGGYRYHNGIDSTFTDYLGHHPEISEGMSGYRHAQGCYHARIVRHGLPFPDSSIESIISHHALEHIGEGFIPLVDDIYRVLKPGGIFRAITPLFPSTAAVSDADHCRYFMEDTWEAFCGTPGDTPQNCWLAGFSVPYTRARFEMLDKDITPRCLSSKHWSNEDAREIRVALKAMK